MQLNIHVQKPAYSYLIKINDNNDETMYYLDRSENNVSKKQLHLVNIIK